MTNRIVPVNKTTSETPLACITRADGSRVTVAVIIDPDAKELELSYIAPDGTPVAFDSASDTVVWGQCPISAHECDWISAQTLTADGALTIPAGATSLHAQNRSTGPIEYSRDGTNWKQVNVLGTFYVTDTDGLSAVQVRSTSGQPISVVVDYYGG